MKKTGKEGIQKGIISGTLAVVLVLTAVVGVDFSTRKDAKAGTGMNTGTSRAAVTEELTAKRSKFGTASLKQVGKHLSGTGPVLLVRPALIALTYTLLMAAAQAESI